MDSFDLFQRLGLALAIGLLIGLERGWREREAASGTRTAGIRTFALTGLFGGVWGALVPQLGPWPVAVAGLGYGLAVAAFSWRKGVADNDFSVTGVVAAMLTFALGVMAVVGNEALAAAAAVAAVALLAARDRLHGFLRALTWPELRSAFVLLAMTFLLLPVLPDHAVDPWAAINPYKIWLTVILLAALSFVGYVAVRVMGERFGILAASVAGALVSSTAVTLNNARLAVKSERGTGVLSSATALAWSISLTRQFVLAGTINRDLIPFLAVVMGAAVAVMLLTAAIFYLREHKAPTGDGLKLGNPFDLGPVLGLGALIAGVLLVSKILSDNFGQAGLLPFAAISGTMDVDPITVSAAQLAGSTVTLEQATLAIVIAACANLTTKSVAAISIGGPRFGIPLALAAVLAGAAALTVWMAFGGVRV